MFEIRPVRSAQQRRDFLAVPHRVYRDDPHWVAPLYAERRAALSPKHPFFAHARWQAWVAYRDSIPVGRICAQVDELQAVTFAEPWGYFGMIEADNDPMLFADLFASAEQWLREQQRTHVVGPFNLGINQELGLLVDGFDTPPFFMMPHGRPYYAEQVQAQGYQSVQTLLAYLCPPDFQAPAVMQRLLSRQGEHIKLRPLKRRNLRAEIATLRDIFNDAWSDNWGFVPFTSAEFQALGRELIMLLPSDYVQIAEYDGEAAGFIVMLPNINEAIADLRGRLLPLGWAKALWRLKVRHPRTARVPLMGVRKAFQQGRLGSALAFALIDEVRGKAAARGVNAVEMSWILESNQGMRSIGTAIGGHISKRYQMFEKRLT